VTLATPTIPLPDIWPEQTKSGLLFAIALAHRGVAYVRGWCADSRIARVRLAAENDRLKAEVAMLRQEVRIKDARWTRIPPAKRPHYPPADRLATLALKAARGWNKQQTAGVFAITPATVSSWMQRVDEDGPNALLQTSEPVNRFPDLTRQLVQKLKTLCPAMGKVRVSQLLASAGLNLSASTVRRIIKEPPVSPKPDGAPKTVASQPKKASGRTVTARYPHHVWNLDHSVIPTAAGLWVPWPPLAAWLGWPFCWWVSAVLDHFSRKPVAFEVFTQQPSEEDVCRLLDRAVAKVGRAPKYTVSDQGVQFRQGFRDWCTAHGVKPRFGAVGESGSIAVLERWWLTLKTECTSRILVPYAIEAMRAEIARFIRWYAEFRPHQGLGGATPSEVYEGRLPACRGPRFEPRARYPAAKRQKSATPLRAGRGARLELVVSYHEGERHLPIVELNAAA
jgi:transposase InsO family protein